MNIVFSSDNNFVRHLGVALCSLLENSINKNNFNIYVIDGDISTENKLKLLDLEKKYGFTIIYLKPNKHLFENVYISGHISKAAYYRLSIGRLLPESVHKIIYIDCDTVINGRLDKLWNTDLDNNIIGAVTEKGCVDFAKLNIISAKDYFNSGVMLIDLDMWRKNHIEEKCFLFIKNNPEKIIWWDQDILNGVMFGKWKNLPDRYNAMVQSVIPENAIIIHYNSFIKPWDYLCNHPKRYLYNKYLAMTEWKNYKPKFPKIKEILKYYYHILVGEKIRFYIRKNISVPLGLKKGV